MGCGAGTFVGVGSTGGVTGTVTGPAVAGCGAAAAGDA
jgi:hypothetical protein